MGTTQRIKHKTGLVDFLTAYAEQKDGEDQEVEAPDAEDEAKAEEDDEATEVEIVIPEDLESVEEEDLQNLHSAATNAFDTLYGEDGSGLNDEGLEALSVLTDGVTRVKSEMDRRLQVNTERAEKATALRAKMKGSEFSDKPAETEGYEKPAEVEGTDDKVEDTSGDKGEKESFAKDNTIRVNVAGMRRQSPAQKQVTEVEAPAKAGVASVLRAGENIAGYNAGQGIDWDNLSQGLDKRLAQFNVSQFAQAAARGQHITNQSPLAVIQKPIPADLMIDGADRHSTAEILDRAADQNRLEGNSLVAAGGWCAPSETLYDLLEMETREGIFSTPEVGVTRGGLVTSPGPNFAELFGAGAFFNYTEAQDIAGDYDGAGGGSKPCYFVPCPEFHEDRLGYSGVCISAGLLQSRGYPEVISRTTRGVLVAHDHKMAGRKLAKIAAGSTKVNMPANQVGATAPLLTAIELQVEQYRQVHRMGRGAALEAVFPFWVHGVVRADLSRRLGVDMFDVPDERINGWFRDRGIAPQFVYNYDDLTTDAVGTTVYPTRVKFLLYAAGTWVTGTSDIITIDTLYDSVKLGKNNYTALFTEEGWMVVKRGHDSREVTVPISADGATHGGVSIEHNGTQSSAAQV